MSAKGQAPFRLDAAGGGGSSPARGRRHPSEAAAEETISGSSRSRGLLAVLAALLLISPGGRAQNDSGEDVRFRLRTAVELVLVPVTAKDGRGNLVTDLQREEFRLYENDREQQLRYFSIDAFPLSAVVLVDVGLAPAARETVQASLAALPSAFAPADEFALFVFDTYPRQVLDFTRQPEKLATALNSLKEGQAAAPAASTGGPLTAGPRVNTVPVGPGVPATLPRATKSVKSIHDALYAAGLALRRREPGRRRVIFIVSDGVNSRLNTHSFEETRDLLLQDGVSVYALGVGNASAPLGGRLLSAYARATGGDLYAPLKQEALVSAWLRVAEQARHQYTLVYAARPATARREYRRIRVEVSRPGVRLLTRQGYFTGVPLE